MCHSLKMFRWIYLRLDQSTSAISHREAKYLPIILVNNSHICDGDRLFSILRTLQHHLWMECTRLYTMLEQDVNNRLAIRVEIYCVAQRLPCRFTIRIRVICGLQTEYPEIWSCILLMMLQMYVHGVRCIQHHHRFNTRIENTLAKSK